MRFTEIGRTFTTVPNSIGLAVNWNRHLVLQMPSFKQSRNILGRWGRSDDSFILLVFVSFILGIVCIVGSSLEFSAIWIKGLGM